MPAKAQPPPPEQPVPPRKLFDNLGTLCDDNLARLAVVERLCRVYSIHDHEAIEFGDEEAFWRGLSDIIAASARATEAIRELGDELWTHVRGAR